MTDKRLALWLLAAAFVAMIAGLTISSVFAPRPTALEMCANDIFARTSAFCQTLSHAHD